MRSIKYYSQRSEGSFCLELQPNTNEGQRLMKDTYNYYKYNLFSRKRTGNVKNKSNSPLNIRLVAKTSGIRSFSQNIRSDVKTSEVATLPAWVSFSYLCDARLRVCQRHEEVHRSFFIRQREKKEKSKRGDSSSVFSLWRFRLVEIQGPHVRTNYAQESAFRSSAWRFYDQSAQQAYLER